MNNLHFNALKRVNKQSLFQGVVVSWKSEILHRTEFFRFSRIESSPAAACAGFAKYKNPELSPGTVVTFQWLTDVEPSTLARALLPRLGGRTGNAILVVAPCEFEGDSKLDLLPLG